MRSSLTASISRAVTTVCQPQAVATAARSAPGGKRTTARPSSRAALSTGPTLGAGARLVVQGNLDPVLALAGSAATLGAIAYGILVMAPWYAYLGVPIWDPAAPWPFGVIR